MLSFIYNNRSLFMVLGFILLLIILYFIVKKIPAKVIKKQAKEKQEVVEKTEASQEISSNPEEQVSEEKTQSDEEKNKKQDKKPKIVQIYKREQRQTDGENKPQKVVDPIYDRNVEFVNTSKNIAKFKSFAEEKPVKENTETEKADEYGFVQDKQDDCEFCEDNVKHFDHSKRLSSIMKDDGEDMFASHISDKYLNINSDRHLNLDEKFNRDLFAMTERMMINSEEKVRVESDNECDCGHPCCEDEIENDDVKINMKTALIADTYFHRKKKK